MSDKPKSLAEQMREALAKKNAALYPEGSVKKGDKAEKVKVGAGPVIKPMRKSAGRGR